MTFAAISAEVPPTFQWAKQLAGTDTGHVWVYGHCLDELGNSYLAGSFRGNMSVAGSITLTNGSIFLIKFDRRGNVVWARRDGGFNSEGYALSRGTDGHLYLLARVGDTPATIADTNVTGYIVLAKYTSEGQGVWARTVSSSGNAIYPYGLAIESSGAAYWTAYFYGPATIGSTNLTSTGWGSPVFVKCDQEGSVVWVKAVRGPGTNGPSASLCWTRREIFTSVAALEV